MSRHIHIAGVAKTYITRNGAVESLKPIGLHVEPGEFVVIVGPSGCGKSTLLKIVAGLTPASAGHVDIGGRAVDGPLDDVGIVFQTPVLLAWLVTLPCAALLSALLWWGVGLVFGSLPNHSQ